MATTFDLSTYANTYQEPQVVEAGEEYELRIISAEPSENVNGPYIKCRFEIVGNDAALDVRHIVVMPGPDRDAKANNRIIKRLMDFCAAFDLPNPLTESFNPEQDWVGHSGWAILGQEEYQGEMQNTVKKFMVRR